MPWGCRQEGADQDKLGVCGDAPAVDYCDSRCLSQSQADSVPHHTCKGPLSCDSRVLSYRWQWMWYLNVKLHGWIYLGTLMLIRIYPAMCAASLGSIQAQLVGTWSLACLGPFFAERSARIDLLQKNWGGSALCACCVVQGAGGRTTWLQLAAGALWMDKIPL